MTFGHAQSSEEGRWTAFISTLGINVDRVSGGKLQQQ